MLVVTTDTTCCRIYSHSKHPFDLTLIKEIEHPENRLKTSELTSDKQGHYQAGDAARGAYSPHMDPKENKADSFARDIAKELDKERMESNYEKLMIIAPPHMNGLLFQHLNKNVKNLIVARIQKDLQHLKKGELLEFLKTHFESGEKR